MKNITQKIKKIIITLLLASLLFVQAIPVNAVENEITVQDSTTQNAVVEQPSEETTNDSGNAAEIGRASCRERV